MNPKYFKQLTPEGCYPLGFIGCGNMSKAIVSGLIESKMFEGKEILISGTRKESFESWKHLNVETTLDNRILVEKCRIIFLCVKPNALKSVAQSLGLLNVIEEVFRNKTIVSILAGTSIEQLKNTLSIRSIDNFVRAMPNTPLMVGAGATALTQNESETLDSKQNFAMIITIFEALGVVEIVEESKFHAITGLSGSGPAYVYAMIEALSDGGVKQGLPRDLATKFAAQTLLGASKMILETGLHTGQAKDQVTSAGGTTIYGVHELEKGRLRDTLMNAVEAATKRSMELAPK